MIQWNCRLRGEICVICVLSWELCAISSSRTGNLESMVHTAPALTSRCPPTATTGTENTWSVFINFVCTCYCTIWLYVSPPLGRDMGGLGWVAILLDSPNISRRIYFLNIGGHMTSQQWSHCPLRMTGCVQGCPKFWLIREKPRIPNFRGKAFGILYKWVCSNLYC
jgi:hypothetical protein